LHGRRRQRRQPPILRLYDESAPREMRAPPLVERHAAVLLAGERLDPFIQERRFDDASVHELAEKALIAIIGGALQWEASGICGQPYALEIRIAPFGAT